MTDPRLTPERIANLAREAADQIAQVEAAWCDSSGDEHPGDNGPVVFDTTEARTVLALISERETLRAENEQLRAVSEAAVVLLNKSYVYPQNQGDVSVARDALNTLVDAWKAART